MNRGPRSKHAGHSTRTVLAAAVLLGGIGLVGAWLARHRHSSRPMPTPTTLAGDGQRSLPPKTPVQTARPPLRKSIDADKENRESAPTERLLALLAAPGPRDHKALAREMRRLLETIGPTPEVIAALRQALKHPAARVRSMALVALAHSGDAEAPDLIVPFLDDPSPKVACAAVRALEFCDVEALRQWGLPALENQDLPPEVRAELLVALAAHEDETAIQQAFAAAVDASNPVLITSLLDRVADLPVDVATPLIQGVIENEASSQELKDLAFARLSDVDTAEAASLLLEYASSRASAKEREAAADALGTMAGAEISPARLVRAITTESSPDVRKQLYDAVPAMADPDPDILLPALEQERDPAVRLTALLATGTLVGMGKANEAMRTFYRDHAIPELERGATDRTLPTDARLRAIAALRNARTPEAMSALHRLAESRDPLVRTAAARPLPSSGRH